MPDNIAELHDWQVRIPLITGRADRPDFDVVVRVPAATRTAAAELVEPIAVHIAEATNTTTDLAGLDPVNVDGEPSPAELAYTLAERNQQLQYQRKVLAGLAGKLPMMLQLTQHEYDAADPDQVVSMRAPDGESMVFMLKATADAVTNPAAGQGEALLLPPNDRVSFADLAQHRGRGRQIALNMIWQPLDDLDDGFPTLYRDATYAVRDAQPVLEGDEEDPDVRRARAHNMPLLGDTVDVLDGARWWRPVKAEIRTDGTVAVYVDGGQRVVTVRRDNLVTVRPTSWTVDGAQLAADGAIGRQVLVDGQWRTIQGGARQAGKDARYEIRTAPGHPVSVERADQFQVRDVPVRWS